uniref:GIY endonuclease n=1 Tax=Apiotrichum gamsii TaxID=1105092 RepID=A0A8K1ZR78_9TREE|nr:GIY endonuclease [Apiotrichum gamsii]
MLISPKWLNLINYEELSSITCINVLPLSLKLKEILTKNKLKPIIRWENLDIPDIKETVRSNIKNIRGIYAVINLVTGEMYIGSAVTGRIGNRFHKHLYGGTGSIIVHAAVLKYGLNNFAFVVLESVDFSNLIREESNKNLLMREDFYLFTLRPMYNIAPKAGNTLGVKHTDSTKAKIKINYSSERREAIGALNRGKKLPPTTVEAIRKTALRRSPISIETRITISKKVGKFYTIRRTDNSIFLSPEKIIVSSLTLQRVKNVRIFLDCSEKTVLRALNTNGIIQKEWCIKKI